MSVEGPAVNAMADEPVRAPVPATVDGPTVNVSDEEPMTLSVATCEKVIELDATAAPAPLTAPV